MNTTNTGDGIFAIIVLLIYLGIFILLFAGMWKTFVKAGQPGWGAIIPIYNVYLLCKIGGRPGWWVILFIIPFVSLIISIIVSNDIAKSFGRGVGTTIGLILLPFVFYPILGFGDAEYQGPAAA
jgi:hypothetical protein